jgi:beta-glucuronidase
VGNLAKSGNARNLDSLKGWNRKGLISSNGEKKKAFYILQAYYQGMED